MDYDGLRRSFLPMRLVARIDPSDTRPCETRFDGAALFADVVGYTALTERLAEDGDEGLERLSRLLNSCLARYAMIVDAYGGEVAHFAGDALLAWWTGENAARAALDAAQAIRAAISTPEEAQTSLRLGVASGPLWAARLGGWLDRYELVLGGRAVRDAFSCASAAGSGELVTDLATARLTQAEILATVEDRAFIAGARARPAVAHSAAPLAPWRPWHDALVPTVVREAADGGAAAELRRIASLFVRLPSLDEDAPGALARFQEVVFALHDTLRNISTASGRLQIDDRGLVLTVVTGDALNAYGDHVDRALRIGTRFGERLQALGMPTRIGFAAGRAFCGTIGNDVRRQYVTIGRSMNLAARLMDHPRNPGGPAVLASGPLASVRTTLMATELGALPLKGFDRPIPIVRIEETANAEGSALCGRANEVAALELHLDALAVGTGGLVVLRGEAGIGKTRLLDEVVRRARRRGFTVASGEADAAASAVSYFAFRRITRVLVGADEDAGPSELAGCATAAVLRQGRPPDLAPVLGAVLPLELPETELSRQLFGQARADVIAELLVGIVADVAHTQPLVITVEDGHSADSASLKLVERLIARAPRVLVVLTTRPGDDRPEARSLARVTRYAAIDVLPLSTPAAAALIRAQLPGGEPDPALVQAIVEHTGGNPLFVFEYVALLRQRGLVVAREGRQGLAHVLGGLTELPDSLAATLASRIDALDEVEQLAIKVASVVGQTFSLALLGRVLARHAETLAAPVERLVQQRLVASTGGPGNFRFAHALVQSATYELMLVEKRRALHRMVGLALEENPALAPDASSAFLFRHFERANDDARTLRYADRAAREALALGAYREARDLLTTCLELAERRPELGVSSDDRRGWHADLAVTAAGLGDLTARKAHAEQALAHAGLPLPASNAGAVAAALLRLGARAIAHGVGGKRVPRANEVPHRPAPALARDRDIARAYRQLAVVAYFAGEPLRIVHHVERAIRYAERSGPSSDLTGAMSELGAWLGLAGMSETADRYLVRAIALAEEMRHLPATAYSYLVRGLYLVGRGAWDDALAMTARAQEICLALGDRVDWANAQVMRFWVHHYRGESDDALSAARALRAKAEESGNVQQRAWAERCLSLCALERRDPPAAIAHLERALGLLEGSGDRNELVPAWGMLALARLRDGDLATAETLARNALDALVASGRPTGHATLAGRSAVADVLAEAAARQRTGGRRAALTAAREALGRYRRVFPIGEARYLDCRGREEVLDGRRAAARRTFARAMAFAELYAMRLDMNRIAEAEADLVG